MADERQLSYEDYEDEEMTKLIEEFDNINQEEEEIRQHNKIVYQDFRKHMEEEQRKKERCCMIELQKHIIEMFDLNLRFNNAQSLDDKRILFHMQIECLEYIKRMQRDLLEVVKGMSI